VEVPFYRDWERGTGAAVMAGVYKALRWFNGGVEGL
jgi:malic enzyme